MNGVGEERWPSRVFDKGVLAETEGGGLFREGKGLEAGLGELYHL